MNWTSITAELTGATASATRAIFATQGAHDLYAIALSVAEDGMGIGLGWSTQRHFVAHLATEASAQDLSPEDEAYYRWAPAEWSNEAWQDDLFAGVNETISEHALGEGLGKADFKRLIEAMTAALANIRQGEPEALRGVTLFVTVTDSDRAEAIENRSAKSLNPTDLYDAFRARFDAT